MDNYFRGFDNRVSIFFDNNFYPKTNFSFSATRGIDYVFEFTSCDLRIYSSNVSILNALISKNKLLFKINYNEISKLIITPIRKQTFSRFNSKFGYGSFLIDFVFELKSNKKIMIVSDCFEIIGNISLILSNAGVTVYDHANIVGLIDPLDKDYESIYKYLASNYNDLAKKYSLENPRFKV